MVEFKKQKDVEKWLADKPRAFAEVLAARAALRVVPALAALAAGDKRQAHRRTIILPVLRAMALPRLAATYPSRSNDIRSAAVSADSAARSALSASAASADSAALSAAYSADFAAVSAADSARSAADSAADSAALSARSAAASAASAALSASAADSAALSADSARSAAWLAISADATALENGVTPHVLASRQLWPGKRPEWATKAWLRLREALVSTGDSETDAEDWEVWTIWYEAVLNGRKPKFEGITWSDQIELARVLEVSEEEWKTGPKVVNAKIREIMERLGGGEVGETGIIGDQVEAEVTPPSIPELAAGPRFGPRNEQLDLEVERSADQPELNQRSGALLDELRDAVSDLEGSFTSDANVHARLRTMASRYRKQIELEDPNVDIIFALGLRLESVELAAKRDIDDRLEPELEDSQSEALSSLLKIHGVFIATSDEGRELLAATERYHYRREDDDAFKEAAKPVFDAIEKQSEFATDRTKEVLNDALSHDANNHPERIGYLNRSMTQNVMIAIVSGAVFKISGGVAETMEIGQLLIQNGATFGDKAIYFLMNNAQYLQSLVGLAPESFGFVARAIDWIKSKLGV